MLFLAVLAAGLLTVRPCGGRFAVLADLHLRAPWLLVAALVVQIVTISVLIEPPHVVAAALHLFSYGLAAAFLWVNRHLRGLPVTALGGALNLLVIAANGGIMPASAAALRTAGISPETEHFANSAVVGHPRLALLGDVLAVPESVGLIANVFSVGDVVLAAGAIWLLHSAAGCPWAVPAAFHSAATAVPHGQKNEV